MKYATDVDVGQFLERKMGAQLERTKVQFKEHDYYRLPANMATARMIEDGQDQAGPVSRACPLPHGREQAATSLVIDIPVLGLRQEERAKHRRHHSDHYRVPEPVVDIPGSRDHGKRHRWQEATEPAVTDVVGQ